MKLPINELAASPIWLPGGGEKNEYVEVRLKSVFKKSGSYRLKISCDTDYNVLIDGTLSGFGRYSDFPGILVYDEYVFDNTEAKEITLLFWHSGVDSQMHMARSAYAVFALFEDEKLIEKSDESTKIRLYSGFKQHVKAIITPQLGATFACDNVSCPAEFVNAEVQDLTFEDVHVRPNRRQVLGEEVECKLVKSGAYEPCSGDDAADRMNKCQKTGGEGRWFLFDIGREEVGFPEFIFDVPKAPKDGIVCDFGWGEHIADGMCRVAIWIRRFATELIAREGHNRFYPAMRRLGCRYLQLFVPAEVQNVRVVFHPVIYPVNVLPVNLDGMRRRIYDTAVHTLRCCMHEHYEDCPWREQALYTLDSRNQMLTGYKVFEDGNKEMVRASLDLISRGERPDGLLMLCYPTGLDRPIPFYTLAYFLQFCEYVAFSGDVEFAREKIDFLEHLMQNVLSRRLTSGQYEGLCPRYPESKHNWNFYEWSESMSGEGDECDEENPPCEAPFNAVLVMALDSLADIYERLGNKGEAAQKRRIADDVYSAVVRVFTLDDGCFRSFTDRENAKLSVLTQAMCLLAGLSGGRAVNASLRALEAIAQNEGDGFIPATLAMACWRYDALLALDKEKYAQVILNEIDRDCTYMLSDGSSTFWETILGESDFGDAGSLCHGWSAMAAYYYHILLNIN